MVLVFEQGPLKECIKKSRRGPSDEGPTGYDCALFIQLITLRHPLVPEEHAQGFPYDCKKDQANSGINQ